MNTDRVNIQKQKDSTWHDEKGSPVQVKRLTKSEKLNERKSGQLLKQALKVHTGLVEFKHLIDDVCQEVFQTFMEGKEIKEDYKGNFTWYNFDHSIKVEVSVNDRITFDDLTIKACKSKLDEFLSTSLETENDFIREIVMEAFETSRGHVETRNVMGLLKHKSKIKDKLFQEAMELLAESIRRPSSKSYFRISILNESGEYENIQLNLSSIKL